MMCRANDWDEPCKNVATLELDCEDGWVTEPKWIDTIPVCDGCFDNCHRGGFVNARPIGG